MGSDLLVEALCLIEQHGSITAASRASGIPRSTLRGRVAKAREDGISLDSRDEMKVSDSGDRREIQCFGSQVRTVEEAIAKAEIDLRYWDVERISVRSWPTTIKNAQKRPEQVMNWYVSVNLRRKAPQAIQNSISDLIKDISSYSRKVPAKKRKQALKEPHMLELALYDAHFGKLCWGQETGEDYDLDIAEASYLEALERLLHLNRAYNVEKILCPIGHDFFHANNWVSTTAKGTQVDSVDDRMQRVFRLGCRTVTKLIDRCREIAPIEVIWVPGNHDPETSWYLVEWLTAYFRGHKDVLVDASPAARKYRNYGVSLLGLTHGNEEKHRDLPLLMASEEPDLWSRCPHREWHVGHYHTKRTTIHIATDEFNGTRVRVIPSLSGTDSWHFKKGYVKNKRAAESFLWSKTSGFVGGHVSYVE